jgi:hypothetical protein
MPVALLSSWTAPTASVLPSARQRHAITEPVFAVGVGGLDVGLLRPHGAVAHEHVDRSAIPGGVVGLVAADAGRVAVLPDSADRQRVAVVRDSATLEPNPRSRSPMSVLEALT